MKYASSAFVLTALLSLPFTLALSEREILVKLYSSSNGNRWKKSAGWQQATESADEKLVDQLPLCSWHGVTCADGKRHDEEGVTSLDLSNNRLSGHVHTALWSLPHLTEANFQGNTIKDAGFEGFGEDKTTAPIQNIVLSENRLTHVAGISFARGSLRELRLSSNAFEGKFPHELTKLNKLKVLHVSYNPGVIGSLPSDIGNMSNLQDLELSYTSLGGVLPLEIGNLSLLQYLGMDETQLKGPLPEEVGGLNHLRYLSIQNNEADSGKLTGPLPSFSDLGNLRELYLNGNILTGSIPANFLANAITTEKLVTVGLKNNKLTGELPAELARFKKLQIDVQGNKLNNVAEELCKMKKWNGGLVGTFGCEAILCPRNTFSAEGRRENVDEECQPCPDGNSSKHLGSDRCEPNSATDDSETASALTDIAETPSQFNPTKESRSDPIQAQSGGGLGGATKAFIILVGLAVPSIILYALRGAYARRKESKESIEIFNPDGSSVAPTIESMEGIL